MTSLVVVISIHHDNTVKLGNAIAKVLDANVKKPQSVKIEEINDYDVIGFGSGIYDETVHNSLFSLVEKIPKVENKKAFIFSTAWFSSSKKATNDHKKLREKLESKGFQILDEFQCKGFNTNSFLKFFGGMNKGRPNAEDIKNAEEFARNLI